MLMPELPEVETIRRQLSDYLPFEIKNQKCSTVVSSILHTPEEKLNGDIITGLQRHGKILIFHLETKRFLISQLGMSGRWEITQKTSGLTSKKHQHLQLESAKHYLTYIDPRRFGHLYVWDQKMWQSYLKRQGRDPTSPEFTLDYFTSAIKKFPNRMIKVTLLDQSLFSGIGNYMANEICALAGVRPTRRCKRLTIKNIGQLFNGVTQVIRGAVHSGGVTFQGGYSDAFGDKGKGVQGLTVFYQSTCQVCHKTPVKKIYLQNRGTYYCPHCQK